MPHPARTIKTSGRSGIGDRDRVSTPPAVDMGEGRKGVPDTPGGAATHAPDLRQHGIRVWAHGRRCGHACFPRSRHRFGESRYHELRKPG